MSCYATLPTVGTVDFCFYLLRSVKYPVLVCASCLGEQAGHRGGHERDRGARSPGPGQAQEQKLPDLQGIYLPTRTYIPTVLQPVFWIPIYFFGSGFSDLKKIRIPSGYQILVRLRHFWSGIFFKIQEFSEVVLLSFYTVFNFFFLCKN